MVQTRAQRSTDLPLDTTRTAQPAGPLDVELTALPAPAGTQLVGPETRRLRPWPLRWPALPYLLAGDVVAFAATRLSTWHVEAIDAVLLVVTLVCFYVGGLYRSRLSMSILDDVPRLFGGVVAATGVQVALEGLLPGTADRSVVATEFALLFGIVVVVRACAYATVYWARHSGRVRHATVIVGAGHVGVRIGNVLHEHPEYGLAPVGFVDSRVRVESDEHVPAPLLSDYDELAAQIRRFNVKVVIVAFGSMREADLIEVLRTCDRLRCEIIVVPRLYEVHTTTRDTDLVRGIPLVRVRRAPFRTPAWRLKRFFDVAFAAAAIVVCAPVLAACALAVRWEGGPGIIFRQERVGLDGRPFMVLKFRSLKPATDDESATRWNIAHDDRLGPVGKLLRQTSLDELPQLWNVLRGDMSLVGPRPERPRFVEEFSSYIPRYTARHRVPSGLTGWAQVNGLRGDTSIEDRARFDNYYVENWSLWLDLKIVVRTASEVVRRSGG